MNTKLKCSNCGAEITNLNFGWGKWSWIWSLMAFLPLIVIMGYQWRPKGDYRKDLVVAIVNTRVAQDNINVLAKVSNAGKHDWQSVEVLAELYGKDGQFLTQQPQSLAGAIQPGEERQFRFVLYAPSGEPLSTPPKIVLKAIQAHYFSF
ncbi:MAG: hypothetical protein NT105_17045 [Verrucomicrobia bacterium]|nr:hypothetical protein [Verrucomicrobiota bacterium]